MSSNPGIPVPIQPSTASGSTLPRSSRPARRRGALLAATGFAAAAGLVLPVAAAGSPVATVAPGAPVVAATAASPPLASAANRTGTVGRDGVTAFGASVAGASGPGSFSGLRPIVAIAATPDGAGYWSARSDGTVSAEGDAPALGGTPPLQAPITGMAATADGHGYWLVAGDGGVFAFGDAPYLGAATGETGASVVGIAATRTGHGYWLVARDGGVFGFGDAPYLGSPLFPGAPVVGLAASADGRGYWLVAANGGVFAF